MKRSLLVLFLLISFLFSRATNEDKDSTKTKYHFKNLFFLTPSFYYLPETNFAFGVTGKIIFKFKGADSTTRASVIYPPIYYTLNNQLLLQTYYTLFFNREKWILNGNVSFLEFPQKYFGIGNRTPASNSEYYSYDVFKTETTLLRCLSEKLFLGIGYRFQQTFKVKSKENGIMEHEKPAGYKGGKCSGLIANITYDSRDNVIFPTRGSFFEGTSKIHQTLFGSDFNYQTYELNLRKYFRLSKKKLHILAVQLFGYFTNGNVFVKDLAELGSEYLMRGYYQGRYRDRNQIAMQLEYRLPIWKRFSMVLFGGSGDVENKLSNFAKPNLKYSSGLGIRFTINRRENLNIRIDWAITPESNSFY
ncbi:MAG: BamA/TamA family outer membrane protein, partial [Bacteroidota bacterium]